MFIPKIENKQTSPSYSMSLSPTRYDPVLQRNVGILHGKHIVENITHGEDLVLFYLGTSLCYCVFIEVYHINHIYIYILFFIFVHLYYVVVIS